MNQNSYNTINTIDINEPSSITPNTWMNKQRVYYSSVIQPLVLPPLYCIFFLVGALLSIYIIVIVIGLFLVTITSIFENTMVFIIGRALYNKNFPICSSETYSGNNCYTTKSTYCS